MERVLLLWCAMERVDPARDEGNHDGTLVIGEPSEEEFAAHVFALGRRILDRFHIPVSETPSGVPATVLPAGPFRLVILGIPVPVFAYMGDDDLELQRRIVELLRNSGGAALGPGRRVVLQSFSTCFGAAEEDEILALLPTFRSLNGERKAAYLGVQLVTLLPLSEAECSMWPEGPAEIRRCVERIQRLVPDLYRSLDRDLVRVHESRVSEDARPSPWCVDPAE